MSVNKPSLVPIISLTGAAMKAVGAGLGKLKNKAKLHHIATNKNRIKGQKWTEKFEPFFKKAGLDINKAEANLVEVIGHKGPHPEAYHQYVLDRLKRSVSGIRANTAKYTEAVTNALNSIAKQAKTPGSQVNKWLLHP